MAGAFKRLLNFAVAEDEAINALDGGSPRETISGGIGRALLARKWWAPSARLVVDGLFGQGHCARMAEKEARRRALEAGGAP